jgi:hypothetical protein
MQSVVKRSVVPFAKISMRSCTKPIMHDISAPTPHEEVCVSSTTPLRGVLGLSSSRLPAAEVVYSDYASCTSALLNDLLVSWALLAMKKPRLCRTASPCAGT